jgi:addiction module HigA family antidote
MFNPPHPGSILKEDVLPELGIGVTEAAVQLGVARETFSRVINCRSAISADMAIRLEAWLIEPTAESWLHMQAKHDLWQARQSQMLNIELIKPVKKRPLIKSVLINSPADEKSDIDFPTINKTEVAQLKIIRSRLREARSKICCFKLNEAAHQLGLPNADALTDIEGSRGVHPIPHWLIARAANVYSVAIDFLYGGTDEWELCAEARSSRCTITFIQKIHFQDHCITINEQRKQNNRLVELEKTVAEIPVDVQKIHDTLRRFIELNPGFIDMPVGSNLVRAVENAALAAHKANCKMVRYKCSPIEAHYPVPKPLM